MSSFPSFANLSRPGQKKNSKLERRKSTNAPPAAASAARSLNPATRILCRAGLDRSSDSSEDRSPPSRWASSVVAAAPPAAFARESCGGSGWSATAAPAAPAVPETARAGGGSAAAGRPLPSCCSAFSETIVDFLDGCGESGETSAAAAAAAAAATAAKAPEAAALTPPPPLLPVPAAVSTLLAFSAATMACHWIFEREKKE